MLHTIFTGVFTGVNLKEMNSICTVHYNSIKKLVLYQSLMSINGTGRLLGFVEKMCKVA